MLVTAREVSQRHELEQELIFRARHDALTGLPNRTTLAEHLEELVARPDNEPFAVLFVDLDRLQGGERHAQGHAAGDEVLRVVAGRFGPRCAPTATAVWVTW